MGLKDMFKIRMPEEDDNSYDYGDDAFDDYLPTYENTESNNNTTFASAAGGAVEIRVFRPENYDAVTKIADSLMKNQIVVLNIEHTNKETARRLIDFLSGVAYSIDGSLKRVANNTITISPRHVDISGEALPESGKRQETQTSSNEDVFSF